MHRCAPAGTILGSRTGGELAVAGAAGALAALYFFLPPLLPPHLPFDIHTEEKDLIAIGVLRTWVLEKFGGYYITQVPGVGCCLALMPEISWPRVCFLEFLTQSPSRMHHTLAGSRRVPGRWQLDGAYRPGGPGPGHRHMVHLPRPLYNNSVPELPRPTLSVPSSAQLCLPVSCKIAEGCEGAARMVGLPA